MTADALAAALPLATLAMFAGLGFGLLYFQALWRTVDHLAGHRGWFLPLILTLARVFGAAVLLVFTAYLGAEPLLAGFLGFLAARMIALRRARRKC